MRNCLLIVIILFLSGCGIVSYVVHPTYTFERGFNDMIKLDERYNASFYTEALDVENRFSDIRIYDFDWNRIIVSLENIDPMIADLEKIKEGVERIEETDDTKAVMVLIDSRIKMLESERLYVQGLNIGSKGDTDDGFKCSDKPFVLALSRLFNESTILGQEVRDMWDGLLTGYPQTGGFLSKDKRPKFYDSPFWPIKRFSVWNSGRITRVCPNED